MSKVKNILQHINLTQWQRFYVITAIGVAIWHILLIDATMPKHPKVGQTSTFLYISRGVVIPHFHIYGPMPIIFIILTIILIVSIIIILGRCLLLSEKHETRIGALLIFGISVAIFILVTIPSIRNFNAGHLSWQTTQRFGTHKYFLTHYSVISAGYDADAYLLFECDALMVRCKLLHREPHRVISEPPPWMSISEGDLEVYAAGDLIYTVHSN